MTVFRPYGIPAPQGSMKGFVVKGRAVVTSANTNVRPWREAVKANVREFAVTTLDEPTSVSIIFYLPRPKSAPKRVLFPAKKPDIDKLTRAVLDALVEASVIRDDALVVDLFVFKRFASEKNVLGALIEVTTEIKDLGEAA